MRRVAGTTGGEPTVAKPPAVKPVVVELALATAPAEHEPAAVAVRILPRFVQEDDRILLLLVGIFLPEAQSVFLGRAFEPLSGKLGEYFVGSRVVVKLDQNHIDFLRLAGEAEFLPLDELPGIVTDPVVLARRKQLLGGALVASGEGKDRGRGLHERCDAILEIGAHASERVTLAEFVDLRQVPAVAAEGLLEFLGESNIEQKFAHGRLLVRQSPKGKVAF